ncbi:MAG TPA: phospho-sugar mutase [Mycobacteriales bacterium]|nr:phospho-sugar mutase [Mycobacteriales bacterium]
MTAGGTHGATAAPVDPPLRAAAEAWLAEDPDPVTRAELRELLDTGATEELADRFAGRLTFGTAGLRGALGAGPNRMNRAVVLRAAAGLAGFLRSAGRSARPVVIGYDARHGSARFARARAEVLAGAGLDALLLPEPLPTPVLAFAVRHLDAAAGVMVTASHNPPGDNGYKVYLGGSDDAGGSGDSDGGAQVAPPADARIEAAIGAVGRLADVPRSVAYTVLDSGVTEAYLDAVAALPATPHRRIRIAYTPLHGVGGALTLAALERAGFDRPDVVAEQFAPDPDFPTVAFPNPEEPGAMDRVLALAARTGADLVIANDPDADRCAVACGGRTLRGDEVGALLADAALSRGVTGTFATTVVSSSLLRAMCAAHGQPYAETLTGFKWIVRAARDLVFGYEEALGYAVAPDLVRDKDGISAALLVAELAATLRAQGRTLLDRLDELACQYGLHATDQLSVRVTDLGLIGAAMARLRAAPPDRLADQPVSRVDDRLPEADVLTLRADGCRVVVRPSGTEPKLKAYLEAVVRVSGGDVTAARSTAATRLAALRTQISAALGL